MIAQLFRKLIRAKSINEEARRKERILNILLLTAISFSAGATVIVFYDVVRYEAAYSGFPLELMAAISLSFLTLFLFSRAGLHRLVAYIFVLLYLAGAIYTSISWGIDVPQALLIYALVIVMSGILISTRTAFLITIGISGLLLTLTYLQINGILKGLTYWSPQPLYFDDAVIYSVTLGIITVVSWLSNREIEKALYRARRSEDALKKERDLLEIKIDERTEELKKTQLEKILHLYHLADFGRMTAGLFHDIVNPLTIVSLNLEKLNRHNKSSTVKRAIQGTKRMENFVLAVKRQIQRQEVKQAFSPCKEVTQVIKILDYKAKKARVTVCESSNQHIKIYGNLLRFNQLTTNLLSNAIDAYQTVRRRKNRNIIIKLLIKNNQVTLIVQDFGCGIAKKNLKKIFDPFFTTKSIKRGTGIGLSICKDIVEKEFGGKIEVESKEKQGTIFTVIFPLRKYLSRKKKIS